MTQIGTGTTPLHLFYDSSDRSTGYEQYNSTTTGVGMYYDRDVQGRIIGRYKNTITTGTWADAGSWFYHYTGAGDSPDYVRDNTWTIVEKNVPLPGGVMLTLKPTQTGNAAKQYSLPGKVGHTLLTTDAAGTNTSNGNGPANSFTYDPFGNPLSGSVLPANTAEGSYAFGGTRQRLTETAFALTPISMGARIYLPTLGRFAQVDPVDGGTPNAYVYAVDPVNGSDYSGLYTCQLQCTQDIAVLQPAALVAVVQNANAEGVFQSTVSHDNLQSWKKLQARILPKNIPARAVTITTRQFQDYSVNGIVRSGSLWAEPKPRTKNSFKNTTFEVVKAAGVGCVGSSGTVFVTGGIASIVTLGAAAGPSIAAISGACLSGMGGGVAVYALTQGNEDYNDTSSMYDSWDYLQKTLR